MSRRVKPSEQGQLQGANSSITGLTSVLGPIIFTIVFSLFIGPLASFNLPGFPFILAAVLLLASLALSIRVARGVRADGTAIGQGYPTETQNAAPKANDCGGDE